MKIQISIWLAIALICLGMCANAEKSGIDVLVRGQTAIMRIDKEWLQTYANQDVGYSPDSYIWKVQNIIIIRMAYTKRSWPIMPRTIMHRLRRSMMFA